MIAIILLIVFVTLSTVSAKFDSVVAESCTVGQNNTIYFSKLLPCGIYKSSDIAFACLTPEQETEALTAVPTWELIPNPETGDAIKKTFTFADFQQAFYFMTQVAQNAETNQHHPYWTNLYNTVTVTMTTDDKKCLSTFDIKMATGMDYLNDLIVPKKI